jgi:hypothetical protein
VTVTEVSLDKSLKPLIVIGVYRPPKSASIWFDYFCDTILELAPRGSLTIMGDLNSDLLKPTEYPGRSLRNCLNLANTVIDNIFPTRITPTSRTCLDIIAIDKCFVRGPYLPDNLAASDHTPVIGSIQAPCPASLLPVYRRSFKRVNQTDLLLKVKQISLNPDPDLPVDELITDWYSQFSNIINTVAPLRPYPRSYRSSPWLTVEIKRLIQHRDKLARIVRKEPAHTTTYEELKKVRKQVKSRIRRTIKEAGKVALLSKDSKSAWKFIKSATFTNNKSTRTILDVNILNEYFASVLQSTKNDETQCPLSCDTEGSFVFSALSQGKVARLLHRINPKTASSHDDISGSLLLRVAPALVPNITRIFNASFAQNSFPNFWKMSNVCAIYKNKGRILDPSNYRPISIIPILARIFEKAAASQLYAFCDDQGIIPSQQFGFRRNSSCEMALLAAMDSWISAVDAGEFSGALLIDMSKAFDSVPHERLITELLSVGCGSRALRWFKSYLDNRFQRIYQNPVTTAWKAISKGVPQGSCLSPLLFNIYVRNLPVSCCSDVVQFADDVTSTISDKDLSVVKSKLTQSFQEIKSHCTEIGLSLNASKTQLIVFKTPRRKLPPDFILTLDNCIIKPENTVKLLGTTLDHHLTMGPHIDKIVLKCHGLLGVLRKAAPYLPQELLRLAYMALIRPHLEYASATFISAAKVHLKRLDIIQKISSRIITGAPRNAHSLPLQQALRLQSLETRRQEHVIALINAMVEKRSHPHFHDIFSVNEDGTLSHDKTTRIGFGKKRFCIAGPNLFNTCTHQKCDAADP